MTESEVRCRVSALELKKWELLQYIEPWGPIGLAARINQAFNGGSLYEIVCRYIGEEKKTDDETFERQIKQSQIINQKS
jgi:hypothetical protein